MDQILDWDKQLLLFLNNLGSPLFDSFWMIITNRLFNILIYISLLQNAGLIERITVLSFIVLIIS